MGGQERLAIVAIVVCIFVIVGLVFVFSFLFFLYSFYKVRHIKFGMEDASLIDENRKMTVKENKRRRNKNLPFITFKERINYESKMAKKLHVFMDITSGVIIAVLLGVFIVGLTYRVNNDNLYFGDTTYLTILTGSMEEKHEDNDYLFENNLNDQIIQYSLVGIDKVSNAEDIKLYDIVAYEHEDIVYLHRVVQINKDDVDSSKIYFKLRGDANTGSLSFEEKIEIDDIIGVYNGYQNYGLGIFLTYIKSEIGFIALIGASAFLLLAILAEERINNSYKKRLVFIGEMNDLETNKIALKEDLEVANFTSNDYFLSSITDKNEK